MICLTDTLAAWNSDDFNAVFKREVAQLDESQLPLQQCLRQGSHATSQNMKVIINSVSDTQLSIQVKAGIFYTGILPGCACSDDVAPESESPEFCELLFDIDKKTAETTLKLLSD